MRPLLFAVLFGLLAPAAAHADANMAANRDCFSSTQWRGWSAPGDGDTLYLRVGLNDVYAVGLTPGTHLHRFGDQFLVNQIRGSTQICSPIDLDLTLNDPHGGIVRALVATSLRKLTPAEVEAIAPHDRPS
ncbi:MAG TPA: hypothetical protein VHC73_09330 [Vitreimonas sp.]|jgi:hypothetical protein|nr:hypothetical protein [Vitreimonas sp.]